MQACSLLLGHLWEFDTDAAHNGRANRYTLVHKGKKISLLPLTPNEIMQCGRAIVETAKHESEIQHDQTAPPFMDTTTSSWSDTKTYFKYGKLILMFFHQLFCELMAT
jgi:hypothetical protein